MDLFLIAAWCIWTERNDFIFSNHVPSTAAWKARFISEVRLHLCRYPQLSKCNSFMARIFVLVCSAFAR
jgi:hypothetical protein